MQPKTIERRNFIATMKRMVAEDGSETRMIEGYAAVFDSPTNLGWFNEVIEQGAFDEAIKTSDVRALFNHDPNFLLARSAQGNGTLKLSVDSKGLRYEFESPNTQCGNDLLEMIERGDLSQSSFGFTIKESVWESKKLDNDEEEETRRIKVVDILYDVSPVTFPAYQDTTVAKRSFDLYKKEDTPAKADTLARDLRALKLRIA